MIVVEVPLSSTLFLCVLLQLGHQVVFVPNVHITLLLTKIKEVLLHDGRLDVTKQRLLGLILGQ